MQHSVHGNVDADVPLGPCLARRLDWHKAGNQRLRCLRITSKEEKNVRQKLQVGGGGGREGREAGREGCCCSSLLVVVED